MMSQKWKRIGRGLFLAFLGFIGLALFILCLSNLSADKNGIGFGCLGGAVLALVVLGRLLTPYLDRLASKQQLVALLGLALIAGGYGVWETALREQYGDHMGEDPSTPGVIHPKMMPMAFDLEGISHPVFTAASQVRLRDDDMMIGVVAFGKAHAYLRRSLAKGPASHVVNDMFGTNPVTVTYCDRTDRTRVFTADQSSVLEVSCGGWHMDQEMAVRVGKTIYSQSSQEIPLTDVPFVLMTWQAWHEQYPDSDVYLGLEGSEGLGKPIDTGKRWIIGFAFLAVGLGVLEKGLKAASPLSNPA